jgi:alpha-ketoglutarate-dependent taurine dioxygenase
MTRVSIEPLDATLGARVSGVELAALDESSWREIESAFHEYALLILPDQHLGAEEQVRFARRFGDIEHIVGDAGFVAISNELPDGSLRRDDDPVMMIMRGNEGWHTDSSYMRLAAKASVLSAQVVPRSGGQTQWADMRHAYRALDDRTRERVSDLSAYHSLRYSQARIGHVDADLRFYGFGDDEAPLRALVKIHPVTGRPSLFIGRHAYGIPGLDPEESERLLDELLRFACRPPRLYQHPWQPGDVAVWDNRCVLHRARPFDHAEPRVMRHVRVAGDPASERA